MKRSYKQYCSIAKPLEIIGERWTLLVVRELLTGPKRFKDLLDGLQGIGTNLLSDRMFDLEKGNIVRKIMLPPPASCQAYELTQLGWELEPILNAISKWGMHYLGKPAKDDIWKPAWLLRGMQNSFRPDRAAGINEVYQFNIDDSSLHVIVKNQKVSIVQGPAPNADCTISAKAKDFIEAATSQFDVQAAVKAGKIKVTGSQAAFKNCYEIFRYVPPS